MLAQSARPLDADPVIAPLLFLGQGPPPIVGPGYRVIDLHVDHLGSVRLTTDEQGQVTARHDFLPFGEEINPIIPNPDGNTKMFTGHERDRETGMDYMMARYYATGGLRFMSVDPAGLLPARRVWAWNKYSYVGNAPTSYSDPDGAYRRSVTSAVQTPTVRARTLIRVAIRADRAISSNKGLHLKHAHALQNRTDVAYDVVLDDKGDPSEGARTYRRRSGVNFGTNRAGNDVGFGDISYEIVIPTKGITGARLRTTIEDSLVHELTESEIVEEGEGGPFNQEAHEQAEDAEEEHRNQRATGASYGGYPWGTTGNFLIGVQRELARLRGERF